MSVDYRNVLGSAAAFQDMLDANGGRRQVPTIVEGGTVAVGFEGHT